MMFGNLIECEKCGRELQPEDVILTRNKAGCLIRVCSYCSYEVVVK
jgi:DNA-directed RNA polymerase subunit RPC12/RpoP